MRAHNYPVMREYSDHESKRCPRVTARVSRTCFVTCILHAVRHALKFFENVELVAQVAELITRKSSDREVVSSTVGEVT